MKLNGRVAALSRLVSRSSYLCHKIFKILKGCTDFQWSEDSELAFLELKTHLRVPLLLLKLNPGDVLQLYLAVCSVLTKIKGKKQYSSIMLAKFC